MKATIDVQTKDEKEQIERALSDPLMRAFARVCAVLEQLPSDRARRRVIEYVADILDEQQMERERSKKEAAEAAAAADAG